MSEPTRRRRPRAGRELRAQLDKALAAASRELGGQPEWSEVELVIIDRAVAAADRAEELRRVYDGHLAAGETALAVKVSAELRGCERAVIDAVGKVHMGLGQAKSERHVRAARSRWDRRDAAWAAARLMGCRPDGAVGAAGGAVGWPAEAGYAAAGCAAMVDRQRFVVG